MKDRYVSCDFIGQLGNQLFMIAATLSYAWDHQAIAVFPGLHDPNYRLSYNRDRLFFRLNTSLPPTPFVKEFCHTYWYPVHRIPYCEENLFLKGYYQSWRHFHHHRDQLLATFAPHSDTLDYLSKKYADLLAHPFSVAIHVRTYCLRDHKVLPFLGIDYVRDSMKQFPQHAKFVVFSDRINWCKHHFAQLEGDFVFIEGNDGVQDFALMSMMKHNIIANSTFSWWAAYLNQHEDKKVVAPALVYRAGPTEHFYCPEWIQIPVSLQPYPTDMCFYDKESQSCDNND